MIEDACWLCPDNDSQHINLAKLNVVVKSIKHAFQWQASALFVHVSLAQEQLSGKD